MMPVMIDGELKKGEEVDAKVHKFTGTFRYPFNPNAGPVFPETDIPFGYCPVCRYTIHGSGGWHHFNCWQAGHFDLAQYQTITESACAS